MMGETNIPFNREGPEAQFMLPAHPTVEQQLNYFSAYADTVKLPMYLRLWRSAQVLITDWFCPVLPDPGADLRALTNPDVTTVIIWAGQNVLSYMEALDSLPKASSWPPSNVLKVNTEPIHPAGS